MSTPSSDAFIRRRHLLGFTWLTLVTGLVVLHHVTLNHLARELRESMRASEAVMLVKLSTLEEQLSPLTHRPAMVSESDFRAAHRSVDERLTKVEQVLKDSAVRSHDLADVQERLRVLDAQVSRNRRASAVAPKPVVASTAPPELPVPPFQLLGTELRGGEHFLSLAPEGTASLKEVRLLRTGEALEGWRLEAIDRGAVQFRVEGRVIRLDLPQGSP